MKQPVVYILQSKKSRRYYVGSTSEIDKRVQEHNAGYVKATKYIRPLCIKKVIHCATLTEARKAEYRLK